MKPNLAETPDGSPLTWPKYASPKLDGIRAIVKDGRLLSRSLKLIPNEAIRDLLAKTTALDGELICGSPTAPDVYNKTYRKVMTINGDTEGVVFYVFDLQNLSLPYASRLSDLVRATESSISNVKVLPQTLLHSQEELEAYYQQVLEMGYEGAILRNPNAMYKLGRSTAVSQDMLKMKPLEDSEATVIECYEAMENQNKVFTNELGRSDRSTDAAGLVPKNMVGGFVARVLTGKFAGKVTNIAPGKLVHKERSEIWANKGSYEGKVLTFRHMPHGAMDAPRHARFYRWKLDSNI